MARKLKEDIKNYVHKEQDKWGFDKEEGEYIIEGGVTFENIYVRSENGSNIGKAHGFKVSQLEKDDEGNFLEDANNKSLNPTDRLIRKRTMIVTKDEAINLALLYGVRNAYVLRKFKKIVGDDGVEIKEPEEIRHLYPVPRTDSFFRDDKAVSVYKVDAENKIIVPVEVSIDKSICSKAFLKLLDESIKQEKSKEKKRMKSNKEKKEKQKLNKLLEGLDGAIVNMQNPFE